MMNYILSKNKYRRRFRVLWAFLAIVIAVVFVVGNNTNYHFSNTNATISALSKMGSSGDEVSKIQTNLKRWGYYSGAVDGTFGTGTKNAVIAFQKANGLTADGVAGPSTLRAMGINTSNNSSGKSSGNNSGGGGYNQKDVDLLATIISAESRGEPYEGQVAVGACILNRVNHASFPDTLAGVIYQPGAFTCVTDGQINQPVYESARRAANDALNGMDPGGGAIYYYNPAKSTNKWIFSRPVITQIGSHLFCS